MQRICLYYALPLLLAQRGKREKKKRVVGVVVLIVGEELLEPIFLWPFAAAVLLPLPRLCFTFGIFVGVLFISLSILWAQQKLIGMGLGFSRIFCS